MLRNDDAQVTNNRFDTVTAKYRGSQLLYLQHRKNEDLYLARVDQYTVPGVKPPLDLFNVVSACEREPDLATVRAAISNPEILQDDRQEDLAQMTLHLNSDDTYTVVTEIFPTRPAPILMAILFYV